MWPDSTTAPPTFPPCDTKANGPSSTGKGNINALKSDEALQKPMQLGPMKRIPPFLAILKTSSCSFLPSSPISAKPAEIIPPAFTPLATHSSMTEATMGAGIQKTARPTGPGISATRAKALCPRISLSLLFTGYTGPLKPFSALLKVENPHLFQLLVAPTTATDLGLNNGSRLSTIDCLINAPSLLYQPEPMYNDGHKARP